MLQRKCSIVITFLLLEAESEARKPLSQSFLADFANDVGCPCDRKTIGRDIKALIAMGCPIKKTPRGFYMDKKAISATEAKCIVRCVKEAAGDEVDVEALLPRLIRALGHSYLGSI